MASTFTLTGTFYHNDNTTPIVGSLIKVSSFAFPDTTTGRILTSDTKLTTDANGQVSFTLAAETGRLYTVRSLAGRPLFATKTFTSPAAGASLDILSLTPYDPEAYTPPLVDQAQTAATDAANSATAAANSVASIDPPSIKRRWNVVTTSASTYTANPGEWVRSSGAPATITLPASPMTGDTVAIQRAAGSITVSVASGSGHDINGQSTVGIAGISIPVVVYTYVGSGHWVMTSTTGIMQFGLSVGAQGAFLVFGQTTSTIKGQTPGYVSGSTYYAQGGDKYIFIDAASGINSIVYAFTNPDTSQTVVQNYQHTHWKNDTTGPVTISCPGGGTIDGGSSFVLNPGDAVDIAVTRQPTASLPGIVEITGVYRVRGTTADPTGTIGATYDRRALPGTPTALTSGTGQLCLIEVRNGGTVSAINWRSGSTAGASVSHAWAALKDTSGKVLAVTSDITSGSITANATQSWALTASTYLAPGIYYVEVMVAATTMPSITASNGASTQLSGIAPILCASDAGRTTPPTVGATEAIPGTAGGLMAYVWLT